MTSRPSRRRVVIGVDFGTLSGRAVVVAVDDGAELGSAVHEYSYGVVTDVLPGTALGSAIHAAVAAGAYPDIHAASAAMGHKQPAGYTPDEDRARAYDPLYAEYSTLHDYFGRGGNDVMHRLRDIKRKAGTP